VTVRAHERVTACEFASENSADAALARKLRDTVYCAVHDIANIIGSYLLALLVVLFVALPLLR